MKKSITVIIIICILGCTNTSKKTDIPDVSKEEMTKSNIVASMPKGHFLENIASDNQGNLFITDYIGREILRYHPKDGLRSIIELDAHPAGITITPRGLLVVGQRKSILSSPEGAKTNHIFEISFEGRILEDYPASKALFLNGVTTINDSNYLITDALASKVWKLDIEKNEMTEWLSSTLLAPIEGKNIPAANGIKIRKGEVYISNSTRGLLLKVPLSEPDEKNLKVFLENTVIDDFVFSKTGTLYATTHGPIILAIEPDGTKIEFANESDDIAGGTAAAIVMESTGEQLYIVGDGGLFEGKELKPASLVKIPLNE